MTLQGNISCLTCPKCGTNHIALRHCPACNHDHTPKVDYRRVRHAAHGMRGGQGWDLEIWDVCQPFDAPHPDGVPADAEKHTGSWMAGVQWTRFVRKAQMSEGTCDYCARSQNVRGCA